MRRTEEIKCPECKKIWSQPDWYETRTCPYCGYVPNYLKEKEVKDNEEKSSV